MEWSNIRMSKAEFERLQKEYAEAAIRTAEKAKLSYDADEPKEEIPKTENIIAVGIGREFFLVFRTACFF